MFVLSVKTNRVHLAALLAAGGLLLAVVLGIKWGPHRTAANASTATDPAAYLQDLGYEIEPQWMTLRELTVPAADDPAFAAYYAALKQAGYDLTPYVGERAKCYTYAVKNHPSGRPAEARVYLYQGRVVGGTIALSGGELLPLETLTKQGETHGTTG
ncbi:MAG: DUF4830 domain-containing protein [Clostridia bacterium]|nr:DUF4830 domain-containing protein [Clostridia bacterium]